MTAPTLGEIIEMAIDAAEHAREILAMLDGDDMGRIVADENYRREWKGKFAAQIDGLMEFPDQQAEDTSDRIIRHGISFVLPFAMADYRHAAKRLPRLEKAARRKPKDPLIQWRLKLLRKWAAEQRTAEPAKGPRAPVTAAVSPAATPGTMGL